MLTAHNTVVLAHHWWLRKGGPVSFTPDHNQVWIVAVVSAYPAAVSHFKAVERTLRYTSRTYHFGRAINAALSLLTASTGPISLGVGAKNISDHKEWWFVPTALALILEVVVCSCAGGLIFCLFSERVLYRCFYWIQYPPHHLALRCLSRIISIDLPHKGTRYSRLLARLNGSSISLQ
jgi:hypothetical protein